MLIEAAVADFAGVLCTGPDVHYTCRALAADFAQILDCERVH